MKLSDIHLNYDTDKGVGHNYIQYYDKLFAPLQASECNILEIGVLHGGSIRMWNEFFENGNIYGLDDFSHEIGFSREGQTKVDWNQVEEGLNALERVNIIKCDSTDAEKVNEALEGLKFDLIIDDGNHTVPAQLKTIELFYPYLSENGIYIVEDVMTRQGALMCAHKLRELSGKRADIKEFSIRTRADDRLVVLQNTPSPA